ncbi:unnamed protein product [Rotaria sp. Silwood2]|nr:unnamed protein product [Rotaria sp. Silwood2]CAF4546408.1 unnamed protein product [Rotaria sp. Silwood2]
MNRLTLLRRYELMRVYSNINRKGFGAPVPPLWPLPQAPNASGTQLRSRSLSPRTVESHSLSPSTSMKNMGQQTTPTRRIGGNSPDVDEHVLQDQGSRSKEINNRRGGEEEEPNKWSTESMPSKEKAYYMKCKKYYHITEMPLISISDDIFRDDIELNLASLVFVIDEDDNAFDEKIFLNRIYSILNIDHVDIKIMQKGCIKVVAEIFKNFDSKFKKIEIKALYKSLTDEIQKELGKLKIFFMFMGDIKALYEKQISRYEVTLYPEWNLLYAIGHTYWTGALQDGRDRGNQPYYCPVGWKRYSFYVTKQFYEKFKGWCICYHGTKFSHGLSILLSGLAPASRAQHGEGIYATPSIIYASHPRYAEVKKLASSNEKSFFKNGNYVQFVLQCRVHPKDIKKIAYETLDASTTIDSNIDNNAIEWVIDSKGKPVVDFNDPDSTVVCTGLMIRVTDNHPGLLPESEWWFKSHLCTNERCCQLGINLEDLNEKILNGEKSIILYE